MSEKIKLINKESYLDERKKKVITMPQFLLFAVFVL